MSHYEDYRAATNIRFDGKRYRSGDRLPPLTEKQRDQLLRSKSIEYAGAGTGAARGPVAAPAYPPEFYNGLDGSPGPSADQAAAVPGAEGSDAAAAAALAALKKPAKLPKAGKTEKPAKADKLAAKAKKPGKASKAK